MRIFMVRHMNEGGINTKNKIQDAMMDVLTADYIHIRTVLGGLMAYVETYTDHPLFLGLLKKKMLHLR